MRLGCSLSVAAIIKLPILGWAIFQWAPSQALETPQSSKLEINLICGVRCIKAWGGSHNFDMFDRYSEKARRAIFFARYECANYGSPNIESEHLILGLLRETALLQRLLTMGRESLKVLREEIEHQITRRAPITTAVDLPPTAECERILSFAAEESERLGRGQVEPEHLLLGLLREERCLGARILLAHEVTFSRVLEEVKHGQPPQSRF